MPKTKNRGVFGRSLKLIGMASRLATKEVSERFIKGSELEARVQQAKIMTEALAELKGAAMKAGQLLSLEAGEILPKEATEILAKLQANAEPHPFEEIETTLKEELEEKYGDLEDLSQEPAASASIGQVHRAKIKGQDVAIKVQYPGIQDSIESDLKIIRRVGESFLKISGKKISLEPVFQELAEVLHLEADYLHEMKNMLEYSKFLEGHSSYRVPAPLPEYTTSRVLCMSWEEGKRLGDWILDTESESLKQEMADLILNLYIMEFAEWGLVQTDPNFANFLVNDQGQLVCLDFGATMRFQEDFRQAYAQLLATFRTGNTDSIFQKATEFGLLDPREPRETQIAFKEMIRVAIEPFDPSKQPFDFIDKDFEKRTKDVNLRFSRLLQYSAPPKKILFLHRKLGGIFNMVKKMGIRKDLTNYWARMTQVVGQ